VMALAAAKGQRDRVASPLEMAGDVWFECVSSIGSVFRDVLRNILRKVG